MRKIVLLCILFLLTIPMVNAAPENESEKRNLKKKYLYSWIDGSGIMHIADSLQKVPQQYRSSARIVESRKTPESGSGEQRSVGGDTYAPSGDYSGEADARVHWQQRIMDWKNRLINAQKRSEELEKEKNDLFRAWGSAALAPIETRQKAEQLDREIAEVQEEIREARGMLDNVIPEEARRQGVPPGWLRD